MKFDDLFGTMKFTNAHERKKMEIMFDSYLSDLPANFYRNQFDLAAQVSGTTYTDWVNFLKHPAFDSWKSEQIAIIASTETDKALAGGGIRDKEAVNLLKVRQDILKDEKAVEKPTMVVIPESLFFREDD
jgi:hypothetical protein